MIKVVNRLKVEVLKKVAINLLEQNEIDARKIIQRDYPFVPLERERRTYSDKQKINQFVKDGFIDRYSGQRLVNPGMLKVISHYLPDIFPYHSHWKMDECHNAYWELIPTVDHIHPISLGGTDNEENYATTSMLHNSVKNNWTLEQLQWELYPAGDYEKWDGLTNLFIMLVEQNQELLKDTYIKRWYALSMTINK